MSEPEKPFYGQMRVVPPAPGSLGELADSQGHQEIWNGREWENVSSFFNRQMSPARLLAHGHVSPRPYSIPPEGRARMSDSMSMIEKVALAIERTMFAGKRA